MERCALNIVRRAAVKHTEVGICAQNRGGTSEKAIQNRLIWVKRPGVEEGIAAREVFKGGGGPGSKRI